MNATLVERLENLSPAKRVLLELKLKGKTTPVENPFSIPLRRNSKFAPLTHNQESLLFLEQLNPDTATYNLYEAVRLTGPLDFDALQKTFDLIVARHEALRTTFSEINGHWQQIISPPQSVPIHITDLSLLPENEREASNRMNMEVNRPMDLQNGALIRVNLLKTAEQEHILLVTIHHIISDGWSVGVFWKEFANYYQSFSQGNAPEPSQLQIQFGDFAVWSRQQLENDLVRQTEYWKNQLQGAPALLELPTDRNRPAVQGFRGAEELMTFPVSLREDLKKISQRENVTLFMTLLAAFKILLTRYTGQTDLVVGSPIAGRNITETENLIGFFVNTLALRTDISGDPTYREFLGRIKNMTLDAFSHQELPFDKVVAAHCPERSLSYNPIYQVAFALQPGSDSSLQISGLEIQPIKLGSVTAKFDLFLSAKEVPDGLAVTVEYNTDLFEASTIRRLIVHYQNLLETLLTNPNLRVSEFPLLSQNERHQILNEWNNTTTEYPNQCLHSLFEIQAKQNPENIAVSSDQGNLNYQELNSKSNQIARHLRKLGVSPNSPVGILMERSTLMTTGILGILKAGGAYLPLDLSYPSERVQYMLEDARVDVILTTLENSPRLPDTTAQIICLDSDWESITAESPENLENVNQPTDLAYIIYTSGSTGKPKGTLIPHRAVNRLVFNTNYVQIDSTARFAHISNVSFDAATFELWGALLHGAELIVLNKDLILSPTEFITQLREQKITTMFLTTALFNLLSRENPNAFQSLKTLMFGGETSDPASVRRVLENTPPERLLHVYGPTETTTFASWHHIQSVSSEAHTIPIGKPISNTAIYILDSQMNPVPVGVPGEIFIGGDGLANGYLNRPQLNEEKFVTVPAGKISLDNLRLYRTGDIARYLPDGNIEFIGRKDNQIKLRGFRIELGEIESALNSHPKIKDAIVLLADNKGEKKLVGYFVSESAPEPRQLREFLKQKLPEFMIPALFIEVAQLSLNPNGKIDRRQLPDLPDVTTDSGAETAAADELELKLTWIWQKVLGLNSVSLRDNFFECGGHSLIAVRLFSQIEKTLGCQLPLATLFQSPTIEQLANLIRQGGWKSSWGSVVPMRPNGNKTPFFCVHAVGGNILEYNDLAKYLDPDQPFYGLQALGLDGKTTPLTNIEEMASAYLTELRQIQPSGPYYLGGRSFGGTVAFEMARQLSEQGQKVALLAIFDSYPKGWLKLCSESEARRFKKDFLKLRINRHLENWKKLGPLEKAGYVLTKANYKKRKYQNLLWQVTQKLGFGKASSVNNTIRDIEEINYLAIKNYIPKLYPGKVTFFCATEEVCPEENLTGWQRLAIGGVEVVEVPGDHQTMIKEPFVEELAKALRENIGHSTLSQG